MVANYENLTPCCDVEQRRGRCGRHVKTSVFTAPDSTGSWWGDAAAQSTFGGNSIIYCGYRFDPETENYYARNRFYSPTLGRWLTRDPIGTSGGINLYGYVYGLICLLIAPAGLRVLPLPAPEPNPLICPRGRITVPPEPLPSPVPTGVGVGAGTGAGVIAGAAGAVVFAGIAIWAWAGKITTRAENEFSTQTEAANALAVTTGNWNRAAAKLRQKRPCEKKPCQNHHIATDKNPNWKPGFIEAFARAGLSLNSKANICRVCDLGDGRTHGNRTVGRGGHPDEYHQWVKGQISQCVGRDAAAIWNAAQMAQCLTALLSLLCAMLQTPGNKYRQMITKPVSR